METPEFFQTSPHYSAQFSSTAKNIDHFIIDDLLDFPSDEAAAAMEDAAQFPAAAAAAAITSTDSSLLDNSSFSDLQPAGHFASELCVPYDDMAEELEWLSNIVDESFCSEDLQKLHLIQPPPPAVNEPVRALPSVPAKARSKRSRAAPGNWASRLLAVSGPTSPAQSTSSLSSEPKKKEVGPAESEGRRCLHCATDKTPQWRTGPMGPKTLCNACGVRYKSGRLVPEYRPAASPTFVLTKHSNSHRKVMELRRQKEAQQQFLHHHHQSVMFDVSSSSSSNRGDDYLIHQHIGPDYRQLI